MSDGAAAALPSPVGLHAEDELVLAVQAGQYDKAHRLLLCGANPANRTHAYTNALREACRRGDAEMYAILLPHLRQWLRVRTEHPWFAFRLKGLDVAEPRGTPLELAISVGALRLIPALAAEDAEIDEYYSKLMINRIAGRHVRGADAIVSMLQEAGGRVLGIALLACLRLAPAAAVRMAALLLDVHRLDPNATIDERDIAHFDEYFGEAAPPPPTPPLAPSVDGRSSGDAVVTVTSVAPVAAVCQRTAAAVADHELLQHVHQAHASVPLCYHHGPGRNVAYFPGPILLAAAAAGNAAVCQLLLARGADACAVAANGCGLFGAAAMGLRAVIETSVDENDARERLAKGHRDYPAIMKMALRMAAMRRRRHALAACWKARLPFPLVVAANTAAGGVPGSAIGTGNDDGCAALSASPWLSTGPAAGAAAGEYGAARLSAVASQQTIAVGGAADTSTEVVAASRAPVASLAYADIIVAPATPAYPALRLTIKSTETAAQLRGRVREAHGCGTAQPLLLIWEGRYLQDGDALARVVESRHACKVVYLLPLPPQDGLHSDALIELARLQRRAGDIGRLHTMRVSPTPEPVVPYESRRDSRAHVRSMRPHIRDYVSNAFAFPSGRTALTYGNNIVALWSVPRQCITAMTTIPGSDNMLCRPHLHELEDGRIVISQGHAPVVVWTPPAVVAENAGAPVMGGKQVLVPLMTANHSVPVNAEGMLVAVYVPPHDSAAADGAAVAAPARCCLHMWDVNTLVDPVTGVVNAEPRVVELEEPVSLSQCALHAMPTVHSRVLLMHDRGVPSLSVWDCRAGTRLHDIPRPPWFVKWWCHARLLPDGRIFLFSCMGPMQIVDPRPGAELPLLEFTHDWHEPVSSMRLRENAFIHSDVKVRPDGRLAIALKRRLILWDTATNDVGAARVFMHPCNVWTVCAWDAERVLTAGDWGGLAFGLSAYLWVVCE